MIEAACAGGTTDIVATPHASAAYDFRPEEAEALRKRLQEAFGERIRIHLGCDLHLGVEQVERAIADPRRFSLNGNGYVLIEAPEPMPPRTISEVAKRMRDAGLRPILTHPERYVTWRGRDPEIERWIREGLFMQVTGSSLLGSFGSMARKTAEKWIAKGWVHFLASDAHNTSGRTPDLSAVYARVEDRWGKDVAAQLLQRNPEAAITGASIRRVGAPARSGWLSFAP